MASGFASIVLASRLFMLIKRFTRHDIPELPTPEDDLPTISVCIPARNETHAMTQCLERVIASTYPKLEIIVLDDSSIDNTSILIKSFAHAGVRFIEGETLPEGWLGKNFAQHELYREASGDYILYLDVDTHLSPGSIDAMMAMALAEKATMVSILPERADLWRGSVLFATLRHFWSVISHTKARPATTSSVWLVQKDFLKDTFGGLDTLRTVAVPERSIAMRASADSAYRFFLSTNEFGIAYEKKWLSQCQTSIRLLYPFFGGKPLYAVFGLLALLLALLPFLVVPTALVMSWQILHTVALIVSCIYITLYTVYVSRIWHGGWLIGGLLFPIVLAQECVLLVLSMYAYATHTVTWKGRPITHTARDAASK